MKIFILTTLIFTTIYAKKQTIYLAAGCFWGVEKHFEGLNGVIDVESGYANGEYKNPNYDKVLAHRLNKSVKNFTESVKVVYDDNKISTNRILREFWELHDPTQGNRQGNDIGNNYRSGIFYTTKRQKELAIKSKELYQQLLTKAGYGKIKTEIEPIKSFYKAENYHQDYLKKHPKGYCPNHATGVKFKSIQIKTIKPLGGKEIIVIDAPNCPFCKAFKKDIVNQYRGTIPLRVSNFSKLKGFKLNGKIEGTPTILFIKDGKEISRYVGYLNPKEFYKALGKFKLAKNSLSYKIAFNKGTESRFCKKYDKFKHVKNGVFIDLISGEPIFDTKDRFNSKSGWLSFYKALPGSVEFKEDNSYGMHRVEVIAKKSGIHLGHIFDRSDGKKRFCINANVLEFVPRDKTVDR